MGAFQFHYSIWYTERKDRIKRTVDKFGEHQKSESIFCSEPFFHISVTSFDDSKVQEICDLLTASTVRNLDNGDRRYRLFYFTKSAD